MTQLNLSPGGCKTNQTLNNCLLVVARSDLDLVEVAELGGLADRHDAAVVGDFDVARVPGDENLTNNS